MRIFLSLFLALPLVISAQESLTYLSCSGNSYDSELGVKMGEVKNDFILDTENKTIQQVIPGMTLEETLDLKRGYSIKENVLFDEFGFSINRYTLDYNVKGPIGLKISGKCVVVEPQI